MVGNYKMLAITANLKISFAQIICFAKCVANNIFCVKDRIATMYIQNPIKTSLKSHAYIIIYKFIRIKLYKKLSHSIMYYMYSSLECTGSKVLFVKVDDISLYSNFSFASDVFCSKICCFRCQSSKGLLLLTFFVLMFVPFNLRVCHYKVLFRSTLLKFVASNNCRFQRSVAFNVCRSVASDVCCF